LIFSVLTSSRLSIKIAITENLISIMAICISYSIIILNIGET